MMACILYSWLALVDDIIDTYYDNTTIEYNCMQSDDLLIHDRSTAKKALS